MFIIHKRRKKAQSQLMKLNMILFDIIIKIYGQHISICKVLQKIIIKQIVDFIGKKKLCHPMQHVYKKITLHEESMKAMDRKGS